MKRNRTSSMSLSLTQQQQGGRRRQHQQQQQQRPNDDEPNKPLRGVHVSLSGLGSHEKDRLHRAVVRLGGRYSRDLNTAKTTHLVTHQPSGQKYDAVVQHMRQLSSSAGQLHQHQQQPIVVVRPSWIERCIVENRRVDEGPYLLMMVEDDDDLQPPAEAAAAAASKDEMPPPPPPHLPSVGHAGAGDGDGFAAAYDDDETAAPAVPTASPTRPGADRPSPDDDADDDDDEEEKHGEEGEGERDPTKLPLGRACDAVLSSARLPGDPHEGDGGDDPRRYWYLFRRCSFLFLGYDHDDDSSASTSPQGEEAAPLTTTTTADAGGKGNSDTATTDVDDDVVALSRKVAALVRMGMGTTYRDVDLRVTHVVVSEGVAGEAMADDPNGIMIRNAVRSLVEHHPNRPAVVSPFWLVASLHRRRLVPTADFPPRLRPRPAPAPPPPPPPRRRLPLPAPHRRRGGEVDTPLEGGDDGTLPSSAGAMAAVDDDPNNPANRPKRSLIFRTSVFCILRCPPPDNDEDNDKASAQSKYVGMDANAIRAVIESNGGHVLTRKVLNALLADHRERVITGKKKRKRRFCYVVTNGGFGFDPDDLLTSASSACWDPLLAELVKSGGSCCDRDIVPVTPIWVHACVEEGNELPSLPLAHPMLFQPQKYPLRRLPHTLLRCSTPSPACGGNGGRRGITVAITGFMFSERFGIECLLRSIGATYTETLSHDNTHLICREASGPKYERAVEWAGAGFDVHVVSVEWLYHVVRHGYHSDEGCSEGWEDRFSLVPPAPDDAASDQPNAASSSDALELGGDGGLQDPPLDETRSEAPSGADRIPPGLMPSDQPPMQDGTGDCFQMPPHGGGEPMDAPPTRAPVDDAAMGAAVGGDGSSSSSASPPGEEDNGCPEQVLPPPFEILSLKEREDASSKDEPASEPPPPAMAPVAPPPKDESSPPSEIGAAAGEPSDPLSEPTTTVKSSSSQSATATAAKPSSKGAAPPISRPSRNHSNVNTPPTISDAERHAKRLRSSLLTIGAPLLGGVGVGGGKTGRRRMPPGRRRGGGLDTGRRSNQRAGKENRLNGDSSVAPEGGGVEGAQKEGEESTHQRGEGGMAGGRDDSASPGEEADEDVIDDDAEAGAPCREDGGGGIPVEESQVVWFAERTQQL